MTSDPGEYQDLKRTWWRNVRVHGQAYLAHRWDVYALALGIGPLYAPFHPAPHAGVGEATLRHFGFAYAPSRVRDRFMRIFEQCTVGPLFRGATWVALAALVVAIGSGSGGASAPTMALALSGVFYALPYFFIGVACDFRFLFWTFVSASVSALCLTSDLLARRAARGPLPAASGSTTGTRP